MFRRELVVPKQSAANGRRKQYVSCLWTTLPRTRMLRSTPLKSLAAEWKSWASKVALATVEFMRRSIVLLLSLVVRAWRE